MSGVFFDPELLKLWNAQAMMPPMAAIPPGPDPALYKAGVPAEPPPPPVAGPDAPAAAPPAADPPAGAAAVPGARPEPLADQAPPGLLTRLGLTGGGIKGRQPVDIADLARRLAGMLPRPAPPRTYPAPPPPPGHRPQGGALPMRQATPGNPYLRPAEPGGRSLRSRRRGLLDEG